MNRINFIVDALIATLLFSGSAVEADAQTRTGSRERLTYPVYRVAKPDDAASASLPAAPASSPAQAFAPPRAPLTPPVAAMPARPEPLLVAQAPAQPAVAAAPEHPLDPTIRLAREALVHIRSNVRDYSAKMLKRETVNGSLTPTETTFIKVRQQQVVDGRTVVPFSIYMHYLGPKAKKGHEAIWVEGHNNGKIIGHGTGLQGLITVHLDPEGFIPTMGTNYRIYDSGLEKLVEKLIERAERERQHTDCEVQYFQDAKIENRKCTVIQLTHRLQNPQHEFHIARVFVDDEYKIPIRYAAYGWPKTAGGTPQLIEEFTYLDVKLNVGLTDRDFDPRNPEYSYPGRK